MLDIAGRDVNIGDVVVILSRLDILKKVSHSMASLTIGEVIDIVDKTAIVKIGEGEQTCSSSDISKINLSENIEDVICHLAHDVESIRLVKESEILNAMLDPTLED